MCYRYPYQACTKPGRSEAMYLFVRSIVTKPVSTQEDEMSYMCVFEVSLPSLFQTRKVRGHVFVLEVSLPSLYQARKMRGHVFVCQRYRYQVCTKPGRREVIYLCVSGIDFASFYDFSIEF
jgi:hypothetical protein